MQDIIQLSTTILKMMKTQRGITFLSIGIVIYGICLFVICRKKISMFTVIDLIMTTFITEFGCWMMILSNLLEDKGKAYFIGGYLVMVRPFISIALKNTPEDKKIEKNNEGKDKKRMKKVILLHANGEFTIIIHAAPDRIGEFQWYFMDDPNDDQIYEIKGQTYKSIVIHSKDIKENYQEKWIACHCKVDGDNYHEGCVFLTDDFVELIKTNQFDDISFIGDDGNVRKDISYGPKHN